MQLVSPKWSVIALTVIGIGLTGQDVSAAYLSPTHLLDVSVAGGGARSDTAAIGGGFTVVDTVTRPAGTGVIDPFLRIQMNGQERGYNTSLGFPLDDKHPDNYTHALQLGVVPIVTIGGVQYREFLLDVNQDDAVKKNGGVISLNQIQIFQSATDVGTSHSILDADMTGNGHNALLCLSSATEVFRLNDRDVSNTNIEIWVNEGTGSGAADMLFYVRNDAFTQNANSYVTLFSQFGLPNGTYSSDSGFEEWAARNDGSGGGGGGPHEVTPAPAGLVLFATALPVLALRRVLRRKMVAA